MNYVILILLCCILFITTIYFIISTCIKEKEGFVTGIVPPSSCPNILIKKDGKIYLQNTKKAMVPGVNPIVFDNLEDYSEFVQWQHSNGIHCPVLQLEKVYDIEGKENYKIQTDIMNPLILPPMKSYPPSSTIQVPLSTEDNISPSSDIPPPPPEMPPVQDSASLNNPLYPSPNPMDPNWGGPEYTQSLIEKGYYKGNEVDIYVP